MHSWVCTIAPMLPSLEHLLYPIHAFAQFLASGWFLLSHYCPPMSTALASNLSGSLSLGDAFLSLYLLHGGPHWAADNEGFRHCLPTHLSTTHACCSLSIKQWCLEGRKHNILPLFLPFCKEYLAESRYSISKMGKASIIKSHRGSILHRFLWPRLVWAPLLYGLAGPCPLSLTVSQSNSVCPEPCSPTFSEAQCVSAA